MNKQIINRCRHLILHCTRSGLGIVQLLPGGMPLAEWFRPRPSASNKFLGPARSVLEWPARITGKPKRFVAGIVAFLVLGGMGLTGLNGQGKESVDTTLNREVRLRQTATGQREDVQRYWGFEDLNVERYLSLPYDVVMDTNVESYFVKLTIFLLLFLPLAMIGGAKTPSWLRIVSTLLFVLALCVLVPLAYSAQQTISPLEAPQRLTEQLQEARETGQWFDALVLRIRQPLVQLYIPVHRGLQWVSGYRDIISYPLMFLSFLLASYLVRLRMQESNWVEQLVVQIILLYGLLWWFFSAGIPWYGLILLPMMILFSLRGALGKTFWSADRPKQVAWVMALALSILSLAGMGSLRFANYNPTGQAKNPFLLPIVEYQSGAKPESYAFDRVYMGYQPGVDALNENEFELIYRAGTFMPFFVQKNDQRVLSDNFLDNFQNMYNRMPDKVRLAKSLNTYGFSYLIINLKLPDIDQTPEKSLTKKFNSFMDFVTDNPEIQLVATDRILRNPDTGQMAFSLTGPGAVVNSGSFAVLKLGGNE